MAGLSELLATYPDDVLKSMCDRRIGISARCKYLPTHADVIEYAEALEAKRYATRDLRQGRKPEPIGFGAKCIPFPALWKAFANEPELLVRRFESLFDASRALATQGVDEARAILAKAKPIEA